MKLSIAQVQSIIDYIDAAIDCKINEENKNTNYFRTTINKKDAEEIMVRLLTTDLSLK